MATPDDLAELLSADRGQPSATSAQSSALPAADSGDEFFEELLSCHRGQPSASSA